MRIFFSIVVLQAVLIAVNLNTAAGEEPDEKNGGTYVNKKKVAPVYRLYSSRHTQTAHLYDIKDQVNKKPPDLV